LTARRRSRSVQVNLEGLLRVGDAPAKVGLQNVHAQHRVVIQELKAQPLRASPDGRVWLQKDLVHHRPAGDSHAQLLH
jgi:hypothetical protein